VGVNARLGGGGEFDLIRRFMAGDGPLPHDVMIGPGDDAAVLEGGWVISTDMSVEDVHFRRSWLTDREIGYRAAAAALSDLAAMASNPVALLLSTAAPRGGAVDLEEVNAGVRAMAATVGACVIGGDVSRSPGPLMIDVVALGRAGWPVQRNGAEAGDHVWVTGSLGASAAAVHIWQSGAEPSPELRARFAAPVARVEAARCLVEQEVVDAMIDLSDGLAGDLAHIAAASGVAITIEIDRVPVDDLVVAALGPEDALDLALHGGEDYELCFVTDPDVVDVGYFAERYGLQVTRVGTVSAGEGVWFQTGDGARTEASGGGFDHWASEPGRPSRPGAA
jgi:thiamine-monophosphate kinase